MEWCGSVWCGAVEVNDQFTHNTLQVDAEKGWEVVSKMGAMGEMERSSRGIAVEVKCGHGNTTEMRVKRACLVEGWCAAQGVKAGH